MSRGATGPTRRIESMIAKGIRGAVAMAAAVLWALGAPENAFAQTTSYDTISDVRIAMPDGVTLDSDLYIPTTGCPCPPILVQTPHRKSGGGGAEGKTVFA